MAPKPDPSDLTDAQWERVRRHLPPPKSGTRKGGRPATDDRALVNAVVYQLRAGGGVAVAPPDFPPWQTVSGRFRRWQQDGTWDRVADGIRGEVRPADWSE